MKQKIDEKNLPNMATNSPPILSDQTYRMESELGAGGGVVYKAWNIRLQ